MKISKDTLARLREEARDFAMMRQEMFISACVVSELIETAEKAERLEKEADWLAELLSKSCSAQGLPCCLFEKHCLDIAVDDWREAARKAVRERQ